MLLAVFATLAGSLWPGPEVSANTKDAGEFLLALNRDAVAQFNDTSLSDEEKEQRFRILAEQTFDITSISKFVLGVNWRRATPEQKQAFVAIFKEVNTQRFLPMFSEYRDQNFSVTEVRQDANKQNLYFVSSKIDRLEGAPITIEWRVFRRDDAFHVLDVKAEGVSMVLTLRKEYGSVINNVGIDGLIEQLRDKIDKGTTESAIPTAEATE
jgi:phospholipid transport system substrate-binding protein